MSRHILQKGQGLVEYGYLLFILLFLAVLIALAVGPEACEQFLESVNLSDFTSVCNV